MGYEIVFTPNEEKMKEYKPWHEDKEKNESFTEDYKRDLVSLCMKPKKDGAMFLAREIKTKLTAIYSSVERDEKNNAYFRWRDDENHELWYCGWEFAHDSYFEKNDIIERHVDDLLVFADLVDTPDYFENSENFYKKLNDVKECIDGFIELCADIVIHGIIDDLREFEKKYDEEEEKGTNE